MTIYIVDEDEIQLRALRLELTLRGFRVVQLETADEALHGLSTFGMDDLLLVDVMLATDPDESASAFGRDETELYKVTGLVLAARLIEQRPALKGRIILTSQATSSEMIAKINGFCKKNKIPFLPKGSYDSPRGFAEALERLMDSMQATSGAS